MLKGLIMAIVFASFVPTWARAQSPDINVGQAIVNRLVQEKAERCTRDDKAVCEEAFDGVIDAMRSAISKQRELAKAKMTNDDARVRRILHEIVDVVEASKPASAKLDQYLSSQPVTVGKR